MSFHFAMRLPESHSTQFIPSMTFIFHAKWFHFECARVCVCAQITSEKAYGETDKERPKVPFCGLCTPIFVYLTLPKQLSLCIFHSYALLVLFLSDILLSIFRNTPMDEWHTSVHHSYAYAHANTYTLIEIAFWSFRPIIDLIFRQINTKHFNSNISQTNTNSIHWPNPTN